VGARAALGEGRLPSTHWRQDAPSASALQPCGLLPGYVLP